MSTKEAIQHPNTEKLIHVAAGVVVGLLLQHGFDFKGQMATFHKFMSSDEFHAIAAAIIYIVAQMRNGMAQPPQVTMQTLMAGMPLEPQPYRQVATLGTVRETTAADASLQDHQVAAIRRETATPPPPTLPAPASVMLEGRVVPQPVAQETLLVKP